MHTSEVIVLAQKGYIKMPAPGPILVSFMNPFADGVLFDDLMFWWRDEDGEPRSAPFTVKISCMNLEGVEFLEDAPEMSNTMFRPQYVADLK